MTTETSDKASNKLVFNKSNLDKLPFAEPGKQLYYYDTKTTGFSLRVGANTKTYTLFARVRGGAPVRITLGKYNVLSVDQAREMAIKKLVELNEGINPNVEKKKKKEEEIKVQEVQKSLSQKDTETVGWMLDQYENNHLTKNGKISPGTKRSMDATRLYFGHREMTTLKMENGKWVEDGKVVLESWHNRPLRSIGKLEVIDRLKVFATSRPERLKGELRPMIRTYQIAFRFIRAAYNYIIPILSLVYEKEKELIDNPIDAVKTFKLWTEPNVRENIVDFETAEFYVWWKAVEQYDNTNLFVCSQN